MLYQYILMAQTQEVSDCFCWIHTSANKREASYVTRVTFALTKKLLVVTRDYL